MTLERIDGQEAEIDHIWEALTSLPFLASRKMVVLRSPSTNKQFAEEAEQILNDLPETTEVIIVEPKLDKRLSYYKYLKKNTEFNEYAELDIGGLSSWLVSEAKIRDGDISLTNARYLVERVGPNQQLLASELEKLLIYSPSITRQAIDDLTEAIPQSTIFELLEAAFTGNHKRALELYKEQRTLKVEPIQIIAMLSWQLNILAIIKTSGNRTSQQIAKDVKINPYVLNKSQGIANSLSLAELKRLINDLLQIDVKSKTTNIDTDEALKLYLLQLK